MPEKPGPSGIPGLGPTGRFPNGRIAPHDEGEIVIAVGAVNGLVFLDFGTTVASMGMTPTQALALAQSLVQKAATAEIQTSAPDAGISGRNVTARKDEAS